ncbi:MAG: VOC family protein, partial [Paracoccaceae bacterium]|nr:VOC family protein [Paracoccaceae bacterium]
LTHIDHIAQTMNYEEMLSWSLFYTSIFDARKTPMVDVVDPGGLVRSQAIEGANGDLRITLNGAESHRTFAGRYLARSFGSSVQHVAFATNDIFKAADALAANGFAALPIPRNYFGDVAARLGLEDEFVAKLKSRNILYDRDENGEYFQIFSKTYGDGMFFEIVERRGGYGGYGAANAPFRVAAQNRLQGTPGVPNL